MEPMHLFMPGSSVLLIFAEKANINNTLLFKLFVMQPEYCPYQLSIQ